MAASAAKYLHSLTNLLRLLKRQAFTGPLLEGEFGFSVLPHFLRVKLNNVVPINRILLEVTCVTPISGFHPIHQDGSHSPGFPFTGILSELSSSTFLFLILVSPKKKKQDHTPSKADFLSENLPPRIHSPLQCLTRRSETFATCRGFSVQRTTTKLCLQFELTSL